MQSLSREGSALLPYTLRIYKRKNSFPFLSLLPSVSSMGRGKKNRAYEYVYRDVTNRRGKFFLYPNQWKSNENPSSFFSKFYTFLSQRTRDAFAFVQSFDRAPTHHYSNIFQRSSNRVYTIERNFPLFSFDFHSFCYKNGVFESSFPGLGISRLIYADDLMENSRSIIYWLPVASRCDSIMKWLNEDRSSLRKQRLPIYRAITDRDKSNQLRS